MRDIYRNIAGEDDPNDAFAPLLTLALLVLFQYQHERGPKVYALHACEVECIRKEKARASAIVYFAPQAANIDHAFSGELGGGGASGSAYDKAPRPGTGALCMFSPPLSR